MELVSAGGDCTRECASVAAVPSSADLYTAWLANVKRPDFLHMPDLA